ncbi:MAG: peptidylprolyl isomerase [Candidatus Dormibacteraeota bacterium]|nr:peptidylprolyl isomerase [Candidatus Dormibacteraeota bacterium]
MFLRALSIVAVLMLGSGCGQGSGSGTGQAGSGASPTPSASAPPAVGVCKNPNGKPVNQLNSPPATCIEPGKSYSATVRLASGSFTIALDQKAAPVTVNNFVYLAQQGFYNNLTFHRVEPGFVIQGGDPSGNGTGGPPYKLPNETNPAPWNAGSAGMASSAAGVNGSQFFILLGDAPHLARSGVYNHFGVVTTGMDVIQKVKPGDKITGIDITAQ